MAADLPLADSANLNPVPAIDGSHQLIVTPASYLTAAAMINANPTVLDFLLSPGDYRTWGTFEILNKAGGTPGRPRCIRYYNPGVDDTLHPVARVHQAQLDTIKISGTSSYWMLQGLWVRSPTDNNAFDQGANHNTWDMMLIERCNTYSCRVRQAPQTTIQRCVIRESSHTSTYPQTAKGDSTGIQVQPPLAGVLGIKIIDNEIYNCGDGIQFTPGTDYDSYTEVLVEGNDIYFTSDVYIGSTNQTFYENCIDMKARGTVANPIVINNNRMWGSRRNATTPTPSSLGELLVVQEYCSNATISNNIFSDAPKAMKDESWFPNTATTYTAVDPATDTFTKTGHNLVTGQGPFNPATPTGTLPGGLVLGGQYWIIKVTANTFKVAASYADAFAGTPVDITSAGTGTNKFRIDPHNSRNVTVTANQFYDIRDLATADAGSVWKPLTDIAYTANYISRCTYLCDISPPEYYGPSFTGNFLTLVDNIQRPEDISPLLPYSAIDNTVLASTGVWLTYERKRWTGPEIVDGAIPGAAPPVPDDPDPITDNPHGDPPVDPPPDPVVPDPVVLFTASHRGHPRLIARLGSVSHRAAPVTHEDDE